MRSALAKLPQIKDLKTEPGKPGSASFAAAKDFDFRKALDLAAKGCHELEGYKVLD